jgi:hypothetical protein
MHPSFHHELTKTRTADLRQQAEREQMARAVSRSRGTQKPRRTSSVSGHAVTVIASLHTLLGARRLPPTR